MSSWVEPLFGAGLLLVTLVDVFLTAPYARAGAGIVSGRLARLTWTVFGAVARPFGPAAGLCCRSAGRPSSSFWCWSGPFSSRSARR